MELATEWRQRWKSDVVVDIVCHRKYEHNEIDEPMFRSPHVQGDQEPDVGARNARSWSRGHLHPDETPVRACREARPGFEDSKDYVPRPRDWLASHWQGFKGPDQLSKIKQTGVPMETLKKIGDACTTIPAGFTPHRVVKRVYDARKKMIETGEGLDWAMAEALAFGTLLEEGNHVRLSGQDVERGTFSHRHALIHDQNTGERCVPCATCAATNKPKNASP